MFARFCDPVVLADKGEFGLGAMGWIFTFPCHRFSHFDAVAGVNFDVTRHRAGFQVTTWGWDAGGGFHDIWSKYLGNSGFTKEILAAVGERGVL